MEHSNPRGQCSLELALVLIVLTTVIFVTHQLARTARGYLKPSMLSKELRP